MFSWEITSVTGGKSWFWAIQCSWMPSWVYWPMSLAGGASPPRRRRFTQVSEYWPFFQLFLFNQARHKPFGGSSDAFRILNEKIPSALNFSFFSTLLLVQSAFFSLSQGASGDPEFLVSSSYLLFLVSWRRKWWTQFSQSHWGKWSSMYWVHSSRNHLLSPPLLPKVLSPNETERETMASHFLSIPEELSLVMCVYWIPFSFPLCNISKYTTHTTWKMVGWRLVTTITIRKKALPASYLSLSRMQ